MREPTLGTLVPFRESQPLDTRGAEIAEQS